MSMFMPQIGGGMMENNFMSWILTIGILIFVSSLIVAVFVSSSELPNPEECVNIPYTSSTRVC